MGMLRSTTAPQQRFSIARNRPFRTWSVLRLPITMTRLWIWSRPCSTSFALSSTPQALPFLVATVRSDPHDVADELVESLSLWVRPPSNRCSKLLNELSDPGDVPFVLSELRVRDPRILEMLQQRLAVDPFDARAVLRNLWWIPPRFRP